MKILSFDYKDAKGKDSKRVLMVSAEPTTLYAGTDISSLNDGDQVAYIEYVELAKEKYLEALKDINHQFDLNFNYRQFKPESMTNIVEEEI